ncbi:hypothetical protein ES708_26273 [subsurface metagenome]
MPLAYLQQHRAAVGKFAPGLVAEPGNALRSPGAAVEGNQWLEIIRGDFCPLDVGKVGDDKVDWLRYRLQHIALEQLDSTGYAVSLTVDSGHLKGGGGDINGVDFSPRQFQRQAYGNGAAAGADIGDGRGTVLR